jgi:hypothetical protein
MNKKELEERYLKTLTKYYLHLVDVHFKHKTIDDWGSVYVAVTHTGKELGFNPEECKELKKYNIVEDYSNYAGLDQISLKKETQKLMCAKMNNKFRRLGFKELRCRK